MKRSPFYRGTGVTPQRVFCKEELKVELKSNVLKRRK